jgi:phospholipase C
MNVRRVNFRGYTAELYRRIRLPGRATPGADYHAAVVHRPHSRRRFLRGALAGAAGAIAAACTRAFGDRSPGWAAPIEMGTAPDPVEAGRFATSTPIKRVVYVIKENRTFDHMFGRFPGADGVLRGMDRGVERPLVPATRGAIAEDIEHCYECAIEAWNEGRMDGFNRSPAADRDAYTQFLPEDLPNYWHWAERFVLLDNFFTSAHGPSFPNHLFAIAAQSAGAYENPVQDRDELERRHRTTGLFKAWGCDSLDDAYVGIKDADGNEDRAFPCFDIETAGDLLDRKSIPWASYSATPYQNGYIWNAYSAISHVRGDPERWAQHVFPVDDLVRHIHEDRLPPVTWVTPRFEVSEHPEYSFCWGEAWTTRVVNAIMQSPSWSETAIFITWDDYGGFYDHVPPPQIDVFGLGIRAPMLVISPFAKDGHVSHELGEFSSVVRFIEDNWGLPQLAERDRRATPLHDAFDFAQRSRPPDPRPLPTDCQGPVFPDAPPGAS